MYCYYIAASFNVEKCVTSAKLKYIIIQCKAPSDLALKLNSSEVNRFLLDEQQTGIIFFLFEGGGT